MTKKDIFQELSIQYDEDSDEGSHVMFVKQHKSRKSDEDFPTLLLLNVPYYCNKKCLMEIFKGCGKIVKIYEQARPGNINEKQEEDENSFFKKNSSSSTFHVAYIKFETMGAIDRSLKLVRDSDKIVISKLGVKSSVGLNSFCYDYIKSIPSRTKLQAEIDTYMEAYDKKQEEEDQKEMEQEGVADEDGWVTVTKKGRNPGFKRTEANQIRLEARKKRKRQNDELFAYAFQIRESKREKVADLRMKVEADKVKIQAMREARKFRPF